MITLATPMYDGKADVNYIESLVSTVNLLNKEGIEFEYLTLDGDPFIQRARDRLAQRFMDSESIDLIFLDSDVGWKPEAVLDLLEHDADVVAGIYPKRTDKEEYPAVLKTEDGGYLGKCGLLEAIMVPGGFTRIQRRVFEGIEAQEYTVFDETVKDYFTSGVRNGSFIGEDVGFCLNAIQAGFQLWIKPDLNFTHTGKKVFNGNLQRHLGA